MKKVMWCDPGWQPVRYGFCPNELAWMHAMKRLRVSGSSYPQSDGCTSAFDGPNGQLVVIVTLSERATDKTGVEVIGLLGHEATHVWQFICEQIGEDSPSKEMEAYAMQAISMELIGAYRESRGKS